MAKRFASLHRELGAEYERSGIYPSALRQYRVARSFDPVDPRIEGLVGKMEDALAARETPDLEKLSRPAPKKAPPRPVRASKPGVSGVVKKIKARQDAESLSDVHYIRGGLYLESGDYRAAIREFEAVLVILPGYMDTIVMLGEARARMDSVVDTHLRKGISYFQKEEMVFAIKEWDAILALDPDHRRAADYKARAELILERLERIRERQGARP
jgi:tetratricopeptide (TPR) repeat protein